MLEMKSCSFVYPSKKIFEDLNLSFSSNEINGVLGRNGVGKTTLFKILSGSLKPSSGSILLDGKPLKNRDVSVLQTDPFFYPFMKGKEYLMLVLGKMDKMAFDLSSIFDLPLDELIDNYSTGMRKKIAFIAALCQNRRVLILDEPFNGVDLEGNELMKAILKKESQGRVIICSSHILESLTDCSNSIHFIQEGFDYKTYLSSDFDSLHLAMGTIIDSKLKNLGAKS